MGRAGGSARAGHGFKVFPAPSFRWSRARLQIAPEEMPLLAALQARSKGGLCRGSAGVRFDPRVLRVYRRTPIGLIRITEGQRLRRTPAVTTNPLMAATRVQMKQFRARPRPDTRDRPKPKARQEIQTIKPHESASGAMPGAARADPPMS